MNEAAAPIVGNRTFDELTVGESVSARRVFTARDSALMSVLAPGGESAAWIGSILSGMIGAQLPGPGSTIAEQKLRFLKTITVGETVEFKLRVSDKQAGRRVVLACEARDQRGDLIGEGGASVIAPAEKLSGPSSGPAELFLHERGDRLRALIVRAKGGRPIKTAIVHPVDALSIEGAVAAAEAGIIEPVYVGPAARIEAAAKAAKCDLGSALVIDTPHSHASAAQAVAVVREGKATMLMKGALHTDELMSAVVCAEGGLRTERRISHVYVLDVPSYEKLIFLTDAAVNIAPSLEEKRDIVQNAIDLAIALGVSRPKVAILSAVETVYPPMPSTIDAAALCKMADRGQITGAALDGPLAFDNAISREAARSKGISSPVAGEADILVVPNIEAGNMLAKQLDYLAGAVAAGVVLGARAPIILTSRAEGTLARLAACAVAKLFLQNRPAAVK